MGTEIERKYLVTSNGFKDAAVRDFPIKQGYLSTRPEATVRVRLKGDKGVLTIKGKTQGATRAEFEYAIPTEDVDAMLKAQCEFPPIEKVRYVVMVDGHEWVVDVFEGVNEGLVLAEIELSAEDEAFTMPEWAGEEVTSDERYFNAYIARHPYSTWA